MANGGGGEDDYKRALSAHSPKNQERTDSEEILNQILMQNDRRLEEERQRREQNELYRRQYNLGSTDFFVRDTDTEVDRLLVALTESKRTFELEKETRESVEIKKALCESDKTFKAEKKKREEKELKQQQKMLEYYENLSKQKREERVENEVKKNFVSAQKDMFERYNALKRHRVLAQELENRLRSKEHKLKKEMISYQDELDLVQNAQLCMKDNDMPGPSGLSGRYANDGEMPGPSGLSGRYANDGEMLGTSITNSIILDDSDEEDAKPIIISRPKMMKKPKVKRSIPLPPQPASPRSASTEREIQRPSEPKKKKVASDRENFGGRIDSFPISQNSFKTRQQEITTDQPPPKPKKRLKFQTLEFWQSKKPTTKPPEIVFKDVAKDNLIRCTVNRVARESFDAESLLFPNQQREKIADPPRTPNPRRGNKIMSSDDNESSSTSPPAYLKKKKKKKNLKKKFIYDDSYDLDDDFIDDNPEHVNEEDQEVVASILTGGATQNSKFWDTTEKINDPLKHLKDGNFNFPNINKPYSLEEWSKKCGSSTVFSKSRYELDDNDDATVLIPKDEMSSFLKKRSELKKKTERDNIRQQKILKEKRKKIRDENKTKELRKVFNDPIVQQQKLLELRTKEKIKREKEKKESKPTAVMVDENNESNSIIKYIEDDSGNYTLDFQDSLDTSNGPADKINTCPGCINQQPNQLAHIGNTSDYCFQTQTVDEDELALLNLDDIEAILNDFSENEENSIDV